MKISRLFWPLLLPVVSGCASMSAAPDAQVLREIAPTGKLRFGLAFAPEPSTFFVVKDASGAPRGVTAELAADLARALGRPIEFVLAPNTGELTEALAAGAIDAAFMPVDDERRKRLDIGPVYFVGENTYLVRGDSDIRSIADVDRREVRVIGISGTTTIRSAQRTLSQAKVAPVPSVDEALEMIKSGRADAFALTHDTLPTLAPRVPGSRILDGAFMRVNIAVVLKKNQNAALPFVTRWMDNAKASGAVRRAFDNAGFKSAAVAP